MIPEPSASVQLEKNGTYLAEVWVRGCGTATDRDAVHAAHGAWVWRPDLLTDSFGDRHGTP